MSRGSPPRAWQVRQLCEHPDGLLLALSTDTALRFEAQAESEQRFEAVLEAVREQQRLPDGFPFYGGDVTARLAWLRFRLWAGADPDPIVRSPFHETIDLLEALAQALVDDDTQVVVSALGCVQAIADGLLEWMPTGQLIDQGRLSVFGDSTAFGRSRTKLHADDRHAWELQAAWEGTWQGRLRNAVGLKQPRLATAAEKASAAAKEADEEKANDALRAGRPRKRRAQGGVAGEGGAQGEQQGGAQGEQQGEGQGEAHSEESSSTSEDDAMGEGAELRAAEQEAENMKSKGPLRALVGHYPLARALLAALCHTVPLVRTVAGELLVTLANGDVDGALLDLMQGVLKDVKANSQEERMRCLEFCYASVSVFLHTCASTHPALRARVRCPGQSHSLTDTAAPLGAQRQGRRCAWRKQSSGQARRPQRHGLHASKRQRCG